MLVRDTWYYWPQLYRYRY